MWFVFVILMRLISNFSICNFALTLQLAEGNMGQLFTEEQIPLGCISETLSSKPCLVNRHFFFDFVGHRENGTFWHTATWKTLLLRHYDGLWEVFSAITSTLFQNHRKFVRKGVRKGCSIFCYGISQSLPGIRLWDFFCTRGLLMERFLPALELGVLDGDTDFHSYPFFCTVMEHSGDDHMEL